MESENEPGDLGLWAQSLKNSSAPWENDYFEQTNTNPTEKPQREKCPNTELFLACIFLYSGWIQENTGHK